MLTLAGFPLTLEDINGSVYSWVEQNINPTQYIPWLRRAFPGYGYVELTWPTGFHLERPFKINRFYWPVGASRWAFGHFLADAFYTDKIRQAAYGSDGTKNNVIPLVMDSPGAPSSEQLNTNLYLLPPTPLSAVPLGQNGSINNLYLLTVVDQRYYWWYISTPALSFGDTTSWTTAFNTVKTALGISDMTIDTINPAYLNASPQLNLSYEVIPPWFDALAFNVGQRVVVGFDGSVSTQNYSTALSSRNNDIGANPLRMVAAGGSRFMDQII